MFCRVPGVFFDFGDLRSQKIQKNIQRFVGFLDSRPVRKHKKYYYLAAAGVPILGLESVQSSGSVILGSEPVQTGSFPAHHLAETHTFLF